MQRKTRIFVPVSVGELVDKVTILSIKLQRIIETKRDAVRQELMELEAPMKKVCTEFPIVKDLARDIMEVNSNLWDLENQRADLMSSNASLEEIGKISNQITLLNFDRHQVKADINRITRSDIVEQKSYGLVYED